MATPVLLQNSWQRGMQQDIPRTSMVQGSSWNIVDMIPDLTAELEKRGGWAYGSNDISAVKATASYVFAVRYVPFTGGAKLCCVDEDGELYTVNTSTLAVTDVGAAVTPLQTAFHADKLILPANDGTTAPKYYDGTTLGNLAGSPPTGKYTGVYRDRTVIANTSSNPTYFYFSDPADPTGWDTTNSWLSVGQPITGVASLPGALMLFQDSRCSRVRGATPPPQSDMIVDDPIFDVGCTDARSIAVLGGVAAFANPTGVYLTNGTSIPTDLTSAAGLTRYWQSIMSGYSASSWTLAGGFYQGNYVIAVMDGSTFKDAIVFNLEKYRAWRASNLTAVCFDNATQISEELWFGCRDEPRLGRMSTMWAPSGTYKNDADGTAVTCTLETAVFGTNPPGQKAWREVYLEYEMTDAASDNPELTVSYLKNPSGSYTALGTTLAETTSRTRKRLAVRIPSDGMGFKIVQSNASAVTRLHAIEAQVHARTRSRLEQ